jgi:CheY-like chemotaxis protein
MAEIPRGHGERILFVDDEPALTRVSERLLEALGYRASTFNRPEDALTAFERAPGDFDAVIADLTMPGMSGLDFSRKVLTLSPHMPILLATGYVGVVEPETIRQFGLRGILAKPVTADEVAQALHQILNGASASLGIASS